MALAGLVLVLGALSLGWIYFDRVVLSALAPRAPFDPSRVPPAPSYERAEHWSARRSGNESAAADVFYVHPTSYVAAEWNARLDDAEVNRATDRGATGIQATAFDCCRVYAPRYRQANLTAFVRPSGDGARAISLAGDDVEQAFEHYLAHDSGSRPFIIAAHSQGAVHATRLLARRVASSALRARLVAAYLIGSPITEASLASTGLTACDGPTQTGCVVAYNARSEGYRGGVDFVEAPSGAAAASPRLCVNPLSWRHDEQQASASLNLGAVFWDPNGVRLAPRPGFTGARCDHGWLRVAPVAKIPRDFMSSLLDHAIGDGNHHPVEYGLFFENIRANARARVDAWLAAQPRS